MKRADLAKAAEHDRMVKHLDSMIEKLRRGGTAKIIVLARGVEDEDDHAPDSIILNSLYASNKLDELRAELIKQLGEMGVST